MKFVQDQPEGKFGSGGEMFRVIGLGEGRLLAKQEDFVGIVQKERSAERGQTMHSEDAPPSGEGLRLPLGRGALPWGRGNGVAEE